MRDVRKGPSRFVVWVLVLCGGCGRYGPPIVPELVAPSPVENLQVTTDEQSVSFAWTASDRDQRGKELTDSGLFRIERATLDDDQSISDIQDEFKLLGTLDDKHVEVRDALRRAARTEGKIGRRIEAPSNSMTFLFRDAPLESDKVYVYQIVPVNQGGVRGGIREYIKVLFKGVDSVMTRIPIQKAKS
jgi:hypothetical protein